MMESYILIAGLILFSAATTQQVEKGFFDQDKRK